MYNKFFGLAEAPFNITPDSRFLFLSERHQEAMSALLYGIKERKGFILLTGEIGSGKTTVCRALVNELRSEEVHLALILNPDLSELELLKAVNDEFQIPSYYNTKKGLVDELNRFLIAENQRGGNVALIIDEAQTLSPELLEQIRLLSNLETESDKLIQIVLIGQPELKDTMALPELEQLNQRIQVRYHIKPLTLDEMEQYIRHRLFVARAKVDVEFTEAALRMCFEYTAGVPRRVNSVCDRALLACYVAGTYTVDEKIMQKAVQEISGTGPKPAVRTLTKPAASSLRERFSGLLTSTTAMLGASAVVIVLLVLGGVALGVRLANVQSVDNGTPPPPRAEMLTPELSDDETSAALAARDAETSLAEASTTSTVTVSAEPTAAPTPPPNLEERRRNNPNWMWERNAPLVRVNNPKSVYRAAQLSMLKIWGLVVDLRDLARLGEELAIDGRITSERWKIYQAPVSGTFKKASRLNVPLIVKLRDPRPDESQYVVLLRTQGDVVDVGDPVWGMRTYKGGDFGTRWESATALFRDVKGLKEIKRGEKDERARALQVFLKDKGFITEITGMLDAKTAEGILKFQEYYELTATGQLDDLTVMVLNSRMMQDGPKLNAAYDLN